jgi:glutamate-5-semialdehyde dehydrogenase
MPLPRASVTRASDVLAANARDLAGMRQRAVTVAYQERATLNPARVEAIAAAVEAIAALPDPVGDEIAAWERPNGLNISRVRTPLGVIGIIFESRPNVTVDAAALAMKSGNASILRGGSDTIETNQALYARHCRWLGVGWSDGRCGAAWCRSPTVLPLARC